MKCSDRIETTYVFVGGTLSRLVREREERLRFFHPRVGLHRLFERPAVSTEVPAQVGNMNIRPVAVG